MNQDAINVPGTESHFDNLADILPEDDLRPIGNEMVQNYMDYKSSRKEWEKCLHNWIRSFRI